MSNATNHIVAAEPARFCKRVELSDVRVSKPYGESMLQFPTCSSIGIAIALSRGKSVLSARISRRR